MGVPKVEMITGRADFFARGAIQFAKTLKEIEEAAPHEDRVEARSQAIIQFNACLLFCRAWLESHANQFVQFSSDRAHIVEKVWGVTPLEKFGVLLKARHERDSSKWFKAGEQPYQGAKLVVKMANELVHFKGVKHYERHERHKKLEEQVKGLRLPESVFAPKDSPFFPDKCSSFAHARYAVIKMDEFLTKFEELHTASRLFRPDDIPGRLS